MTSFGERIKARSRYVQDRYANDPVGWTTDKRGAHVWSKQRELLESVRDNRFTACHSMHGTGKSWTAADLVSWWIDAHPTGEAFAVTTAPTSAQVDAILWREIGSAHTKASLPGHIAHGGFPKWMIGDEMVGYGRKPTDYTDPNKAMQSFQGIHAKWVLVIMDEACGIPKWLWDAVDTLVTNEYSRVLAIGNPDDPASHFEQVCRPGSGWNVVHIGAQHLPCNTGEEVPQYLHDVLTGPTWIEERRKRWGEASPLYTSKVLGLFPEVADDTLIAPRLIRDAYALELSGIERGIFGADIARMGRDGTYVYRNRGGQIRFYKRYPKQDTMKTANGFKAIIDDHGNAIPFVLDAGGMGVGVFDRLKELDRYVIAFDGGAGAYDELRFTNRRAEVYWVFKDMLEAGEIDLDEMDDELASQLQSIKWDRDSRGRIKMESKKDMLKRGLPSPDRADACIYSTVYTDMMFLDSADEDATLAPSLTGDLLDKIM